MIKVKGDKLNGFEDFFESKIIEWIIEKIIISVAKKKWMGKNRLSY